MEYTVRFYAHKCDVTGIGFNTGFLVDGTPIATAEYAEKRAISMGFDSIASAHLADRLHVVDVRRHEDMNYVQYGNQACLEDIATLGLSFEQMKKAFPLNQQYAKLTYPFADQTQVCNMCHSNKGLLVAFNGEFNQHTKRFDLSQCDYSDCDYCTECDHSCESVTKISLYKLSADDVVREYRNRGVEIDSSDVSDDWVSECCKCSVSGKVLLHDDEAYTNALTGLPLSDECAFSSDGVYWHA